MDLLFVYGTLRRAFGHPMHGVIAAAATPLGEGVADGTLYDLGPYPGMTREGSASGVRGEVHQLDASLVAETLAELDEYEGIRAGEVDACAYRRELVEVRLATGERVRAWAYVLARRPPAASPIPGGDWLAR